MSEEKRCSKCGAPVSEAVAGGFCTACLLEDGLTPSAAAVAESVPLKNFGDYELLEEIARGGMGVVYRARQISLNRIVAIKMILGGQLAGAAEVARFRTEAETAARLQHPGIVAVHEVGEVEGNHYFSMDYVAGRTLAELVREQPLPARRAAQYGRAIAEAIQFAHEQGVLHRDLKPSNVLIDAEDQPRVTDFGLAKWLEGKSELTMTGQVLGSPSFIPPEQAGGKGRAVGPASDVYSLGAILYHLLTGHPPFVAETVTQTLRMVVENEPVSPRLLNASVPRDLETICLKCLEKDPQRRYASAQVLADELGRFLRNEPIQARPVGVVLKVHRWCLRNKPLAVAGTAVLVLLLVVAIGSPIAAIRISRERARAETNAKQARSEASRSQQVAQFLKDALEGVGPQVARGRDTTMLRGILDQTAERLGRDLTNQPLVEAELRSTIAGVYLQVMDYPKAVEMHREALRLRRASFGETNEFVAASLHDLAFVLREQMRFDEAESAFREALTIRKSLFGDKHPDVALSLGYLASTLELQGKRDEAEAMFRDTLSTLRPCVGNEHPHVALCLNSLGRLLAESGKFAEAETNLREALALRRKLYGDENPGVAEVLVGLATVLAQAGNLTEAEKMENDALDLFEKLQHSDHPDPAAWIVPLGLALENRGRLVEAERLFRGELAARRKLFGPVNPAVGRVYGMLHPVLAKLGKIAEDTELTREWLEATSKAAATGDLEALNQHAWILASCPIAALRDGQAAIRFAERAVAATDRKNARFLGTLAAAYAETGDFERAISIQKEALSVVQDGWEKSDLLSRLKLYESNTPFHRP
jgi:eukaryotic-like serine/threonine-protein kinase